MAQTDELEHLGIALNRLLDYDLDAVVRERQYGTEKNLFWVRLPVERLRRAVKYLNPDVLWEQLPTNTSRAITAGIYQVLKKLDELKVIDPTTLGDPSREWRELEAAVSNLWPYVVDAVSYTQIAGAGDPFSELRAKLDRSRASMEEDADAVIRKLREDSEVATGIVEDLRGTLGLSSTSEYAKQFLGEADRSAWIARWWLVALCAVSIVTAGLAASFAFGALASVAVTGARDEASRAMANHAVVTTSVGRVVLFAVLFTTILWVSRSYRAHRHNVVVNRHRANAIKTFSAFASVARNDHIRDAVLLRTTEAIFSPQPTGYLHQDAEASTGVVSQVFEMGRQAVKGT